MAIEYDMIYYIRTPPSWKRSANVTSQARRRGDVTAAPSWPMIRGDSEDEQYLSGLLKDNVDVVNTRAME